MDYQEKIIDSSQFREVMGRFATGVTIVTVQESDVLHGMTVNSFTSVSLEPMLTLICLDKGATTTEILRRTVKFTVNILHTDQKHLARRFAESDNERDRFDGIGYTISEEGTPILDDVLGYLTCTVINIVEGGDHYIFIGEVVDLAYAENDRQPLLYYRGNYNSLADEAQSRGKG